MTVARYDTDAMRDRAARLRIASQTLHDLTGNLTRLANASVPGAVAHALVDLAHHGRDVVGDLADGATGLADGLEQAAGMYDHTDASVVRAMLRSD